MHRTRSWLTAAAAVAFFVAASTAVDVARLRIAPAMAQAAPQQGQGGKRFGQMLLTLDLSDAQKSQIRSIIKSARDQNKDVTDRQTRRANMRAAYAKVQTLLTPSQRSKLQAEMQAARAQRDAPAHT